MGAWRDNVSHGVDCERMAYQVHIRLPPIRVASGRRSAVGGLYTQIDNIEES